MILVGSILTLGVAPILGLYPGHFYRENREIREILRQHPQVQLRRLDVLSGKTLDTYYGTWRVPKEDQGTRALVLDASVRASRIPSLILLRRALKQDPYLEETCIMTVELPGCLWGAVDPDPLLDFSVHFVARRN